MRPVAPRPGAEAIRILVRAEKGGAGRLPDLPALVLNDAAGKPTLAADEVLRHARALPLVDIV